MWLRECHTNKEFLRCRCYELGQFLRYLGTRVCAKARNQRGTTQSSTYRTGGTLRDFLSRKGFCSTFLAHLKTIKRRITQPAAAAASFVFTFFLCFIFPPLSITPSRRCARVLAELGASVFTASDFALMAERSTVLHVSSGHTYLSRKTGCSTPPLHTPRQNYTHT